MLFLYLQRVPTVGLSYSCLCLAPKGLLQSCRSPAQHMCWFQACQPNPRPHCQLSHQHGTSLHAPEIYAAPSSSSLSVAGLRPSFAALPFATQPSTQFRLLLQNGCSICFFHPRYPRFHHRQVLSVLFILVLDLVYSNQILSINHTSPHATWFLKLSWPLWTLI